ncbi:MAG TPA: AI-2E family transporter [Bryobacteraceae bacterium]|nr:AI-2E family transporter [Bryobacteraceae bacterium]
MSAYTATPKQRTQRSKLSPALIAAIVIAALYFGKEILVPFALAVLLSFLLTFPVTWLERWKLGRTPAVIVVLLFVFALGSGLIWLGASQLSGIVERLPEYQTNIGKKLQRLRNPAGPGLARALNSLENLKAGLNENRPAPSGSGQPPAPVPVEVVSTNSGFLASLGVLSPSLIHDAAIAGAVLVLTLFMLINRGQLRNRLFRLMGQGHLVVMTTALDDAATRVSRYLLTQSLVNSTFGCLLGLGLYAIGVPYAPFWGVLGACLRFIPYVGTLVAGACPFILSLAVFSGWHRPLLVVALFAGIEGMTSSVVEPWLYATRTGISSLAILLSAAFWTLVWGPIGLVLSTPMTVCLAVLGRHLPPLEFLHVLLGDEPVLAPAIQYYERLLALDEDGASELAETLLKEKTLLDVYDSMLIPALYAAEQDRHGERLDKERAAFVLQSTREIIDDLGERSRAASESPAEEADVAPKMSFICVPARDEADELVALMLAHLLRRAGHYVDVVPVGSGDDWLHRALNKGVDAAFVSALPPFAIFQARAACRKLRKLDAHLKIVLGLWNSPLASEKIKERLASACSDSIATSLAEAISAIQPPETPAEAEIEGVAANRQIS